MKDKDHKKSRNVFEKHINRKLTINEIIHHIDGNPKNNDIENLLLTTREEHARIHKPAKNKKHNKTQWNKLSDDKINMIKYLNKKGYSFSKIARKLNISDMSVKRYI